MNANLLRCMSQQVAHRVNSRQRSTSVAYKVWSACEVASPLGIGFIAASCVRFSDQTARDLPVGEARLFPESPCPYPSCFEPLDQFAADALFLAQHMIKHTLINAALDGGAQDIGEHIGRQCLGESLDADRPGKQGGVPPEARAGLRGLRDTAA